MKNFIYSNSYQSFMMGLYLNKGNDESVFLTNNQDIIRTCEDIGAEYIRINNYSVKEYILNRDSINSYIEELINIIGENGFYFTHTQFDIFCFILVNRLNKNKVINFVDLELNFDKANKIVLNKQYLKILLQLSAINYFYKTKIQIKKIGNLYMPGIDVNEYFDKSINVISIKDKYYKDILQDVSVKHSFNAAPVDHLFIHQPIEKYVAEGATKYLFSKLNKYNIAFKIHPNCSLNGNASLIENQFIYPSYIPAEMLFKNVKKSVLSVNSAALVSASFNEKLKSVSLLELIQWKDMKYKDEMKEFLTRTSEGKILFPADITELESILA